MDRAERLEKDFEIEPGEGVKLNPLPEPPGEEVPEAAQQADEPVSEDVEPEETQDEPQEVDTNWRMSNFDFADAVGITAREVYENIEYKTQSGPKSAKQLVEDYESLLGSQNQWNQERQQLQQKAQQSQYAAAVQTVSPEAQKLMSKADFLEEQYGQIDWSQIPQEQRADLKIDYDRNIQATRRQAYEKQHAFEVEANQRRQEYQAEARRETLRLIPEWNSVETYNSDVAAIRDMLSTTYGFPPEQVESIIHDPRSIRAIRDLWNVRKQHAETTQGANRIRKFSKTLKPGAKRPAKSNRMEDVAARVRQAKTPAERRKARLEATFER